MDILINEASIRDEVIHNLFATSRIQNLIFDTETFTVFLRDGRRLTVPYYWFPRLMNASEKQRQAYLLHGKQTIIVWEALGEAIPVEILLLGIPDQTHFGRTWRKEHGYAFVDEHSLESTV